MDNVRLTTRGKILLALVAIAAAVAAVYAVTPEQCRDSATNKTAMCAEYLR